VNQGGAKEIIYRRLHQFRGFFQTTGPRFSAAVKSGFFPEMALLNVKKKEVQLKIVYYGPGRGGKTTALEYIQQKLSEQASSAMVQMKANEDRTLFFDFYPLKVGRVNDFHIRVQLYSVPGQSRLQPLRRLVLKGADSIVFVADAMSVQRKYNIESFRNLIENLHTHNFCLSALPLAVQLNKVDLADEGIPVLSIDTLRRDLSGCVKDGESGIIENAPFYETSATTGKNILKVLESVIRITVNRLDFRAPARRG
jgi:hypothetical protein